MKKNSRIHAVIRLSRHRERAAKAKHADNLRRLEEARSQFVDAQHRASVEDMRADSLDELHRHRMRKALAAQVALGHESDVRDQVEQAVIAQNELHAAMRYKRTVERIEDRHRKAWAVLATQAADRAIDDIAIAGWKRRQS
ncbi:MAG: hypothetical protein ACR2P0_14505 [Acidimicrobiales bacterium]